MFLGLAIVSFFIARGALTIRYSIYRDKVGILPTSIAIFSGISKIRFLQEFEADCSYLISSIQVGHVTQGKNNSN